MRSTIGRGGVTETTAKEKLHKDPQLQMALTNKQRNFVATGGGSESSPLAAKLQQAWLQSQLPRVQDSTPYPSSIDAESRDFDAEARAFNQTSREPLTTKTTTPTTSSLSSSSIAAKLQQAWLQSRLPRVQDSTPYPSSIDAESQDFDAEARAFNQTSREPLTTKTTMPTTSSLSSSSIAAKLQQAWLQSRLPRVQDSTPYPSSIDAESQDFYAEARAFNQTSREPLTTKTTSPTTSSPSSSKTMPTKFTKPTPLTSMQTSLLSHRHKSSCGAPPPTLHSFSTHDANLNNHMSFLLGDSNSPTGGPESLAFLDEMLMEEEDINTEQFYMNKESMGYNEMPVILLDQMLMEEDDMNGSKPCMYQESNAYQAVEKGFADLIAKGSPSTSTTGSSYYSFVNSREEGAAAWGAQTECNNVGCNQSLDFNQLSEKFNEDEMLYHYTDLLCGHLKQMGLESSTNSSSNSSNSHASHTDVLVREAHNPTTIYNNRSQESSSTGVGMNLPQGTNIGVTQHNVKFAFDSGDEHDLTNLLIICAEAVKQNDVRKASRIIAELRALTSPSGSGAQRMAHYFTDALVAKMSGTGAQLSVALRNNAPSPATMLRAYKSLVVHAPYWTLAHFSTTVAILNAFKGATRVHLVDYGISHGSPWLSLIRELASRPGGAPNLRITGIERGIKYRPSELLRRCGQRLSEFAKTCEVPFQYSAIAADEWENITATQLALRPDEVLVVNTTYRFSCLLDESVMVINPRQMLLNKIRSMNPKVFVTVVANASLNEPFFMSRVRETIKYYSVQFDTLDVIMPPYLKERLLIEREIYGREILNIIACEGLERVERPESYKQWHSRIQRAGFVQKPLQLSEINTIKSILCSYDKRFGIGRDGGWFLSGWRNQVMNAFSIWEPIS